MFTDITPSRSRGSKRPPSGKECPKHNRDQDGERNDRGVQDGMTQLKRSIPSVERR